MKKSFSMILVMTLIAGLLSGCANNSNQVSTNENTTDITTEDITATTKEGVTTSFNYENTLFDSSVVHEINVEIKDEDWADLLANPLEKTKYSASITIDGETLDEVSFSTKGNSSLTEVANSESERYSFKVNFGKYDESQTYQGLDKLNLNNLMSDATYMKDYLSYRIMEEVGVAAPLTSYVALSINGEYVGLYLAVEDVDESFLERNDMEVDGNLYKPETEQLAEMEDKGNLIGGVNNQGNLSIPDTTELPEGGVPPESGVPLVGGVSPEGVELPEGLELPEGVALPEGVELPASGEISEVAQIPKRTGNADNIQIGIGGVSAGADLQYTDDDLSNYSDIFDNTIMDSTTEEDQMRVVEALKQLSTGENLENSIDMEEVIRYFVAHNFVVNYDSYTGTMLHNYYLYEKEGMLSILPWDYNLAFGGFNASSNATEIVNWAIDTPLSQTTEEERPLWNAIISEETYTNLYHEYFDQLLTTYFDTGEFENEIATVSNMIRSYVEKDPTSFYSVDEFDTATSTLIQFCMLRVESIRQQLEGIIPSTTEGQQIETSSLIDASSISMKSMGEQSGPNQGENKGFAQDEITSNGLPQAIDGSFNAPPSGKRP